MYSDKYIDQVSLLLKCLPPLRNQNFFALKGGTAINLFVHDLPRLSVDIDLAYIHLDNREESLKNIQLGLEHISTAITQYNPNFVIKEKLSQEGDLLKILVHDGKAVVKIEPNFVLRGTLLPINRATISQKVIDDFGMFIDNIPMLQKEELYAGKICAALSRQHPRDLFDIKILFENEFIRMTDVEVTLGDLLEVRERLIMEINEILTRSDKEFLLSIKRGAPNFNLLPFKGLDQLPAIKWKLLNIEKLASHKKQQLVSNLMQVLGVNDEL